jgi:chemotaxis protein histidine kinase CheA
MKSKFSLSFLLLLASTALFFLPGCATKVVQDETATNKEIAALKKAEADEQNATAAAVAAAAAASSDQQKADAKNLADVNAARQANTANPNGPPKVEVDENLGIVVNRLGTVAPDPAEVAATAQARALLEEGKATEAQNEYQQLSGSAKDLAGQVAAAQVKTDQANQALEAAKQTQAAAQQTFVQQLAQNKVANEQAVDAKISSIQSGWIHHQILLLNIAGFLCILIVGLGVGFGGLAGVRVVWPFLVIGLMCLGLAQIVAQPWFKWACLTTGLVGFGVVIWWVWDHYKQGNLAIAATAKVSQVSGVVNAVVPVLDQAYDAADGPTKDFLDKIIFDPLSKAMDASSKAVIHQTRAAQVNPNETPIPTNPAGS